jgi:carboxynorspermidine decarboxylase
MIDPSLMPSPCFVLDEVALERNLAIMRRVRDEAGVKLLLALKGFALARAFPAIREVAAGTAASSLHEARLGRDEFGGPVHACCPVYLDAEWDRLRSFCSHATFNSLSQAGRFIGRRGGLSCGLRVSPEYSSATAELYDPCARGSRLGVRAAALAGALPEGIEGLHVHNLCEAAAEATERTIECVERLFGRFLPHLRWINLGGGHLMTRRGYDVERLIAALRGLRERHPGLEVILEPGAAYVWDAGWLVATVEDIVENDGVRTAMLDTSFAAHMPDCLEMPYRPEIVGARRPAPGEASWRMGGMTCLAGDMMGDYAFDRPPRVGDRIVFADMMHYTLVKTNLFNGVNLPAIGVQRADGTFELVREFGYEDYRSRLVAARPHGVA